MSVIWFVLLLHIVTLHNICLSECHLVLTSWPWPWPNDLRTQTWCSYSSSRISKVRALQTDRPTHREINWKQPRCMSRMHQDEQEMFQKCDLWNTVNTEETHLGLLTRGVRVDHFSYPTRTRSWFAYPYRTRPAPKISTRPDPRVYPYL